MALNTNSAKIEITATDKTAQAFESVKRGLASIGGSYGSLTSMLSGGAFTLMIRNAIDAADALHDLSLRTGIAVEQLGAWKLVTEQSGTNLDDLATALGKASKYMVAHGDNLKKLGITATTAEEAILQLSGVLEKLPADDPRRAALAMEVLGKGAGNLLPLLAEGEAGLRKMLETGKELNPVSTELANKADKFNDKLKELQMQAGGIAYLFAGPLMDSFTSLLQRIQDITKQTDRLKQLYDTLKLVAELAAKPFMGPLGYFMGDDAAAGAKQTASGKIRYSGGATTAQTQKSIDDLLAVHDKVKKEHDWYADLVKQQNEMDFEQMKAAAEYKNKMLADNDAYWKKFEEENKQIELQDILDTADAQLKAQAEIQKQQEEDEARRLKQAVEDQDWITDQTLKAIEKQHAEWQKMTDDINRLLGDALMSAFESGKGWGKSFIDTMQNLFNTLVLRPIISAIVTPVGGAISSGITGMLASGSAAASTGGGSGLGSIISGGQSLWSAFSGASTNFATSLATSSIGAAAGLSSVATVSEAAASAMGMIGVEAGATVTSLTSAGAALVGAAPAIGLGIAALSLLGGSLFGGGHVSRPKYYADTLVSATGVKTSNVWNQADGGDPNNPAAINAGTGIGGAIKSLTASIGGTIVSGFIVGTKYMQKYNSIGVTIGRPVSQGSLDLGGHSLELASHSMSDIVAQSFLTAVRKKFITLDGYLNNIAKGSSTAVDGAYKIIQNIITIKNLHDSMANLPPIFQKVAAAIETMTNTAKLAAMQKLNDATGNFFNLFYSDGEKFKANSDILHAAMKNLGVAFPETRDGFKALVEGVSTTDAAGLKLYTGLVNLATPMDDYFKSLEAQAAAADNAKTSLDSATASMMSYIGSMSTDGYATAVGYTRAQRYIENGISVDAAIPAAVNISAQSGTGAMVGEIKQLRSDLNAALVAVASYTNETAKLLRRWNGDGMPETRVVA